MKKTLIALVMGVGILVGCSNFVNQTKNGQITTTHMVAGAYMGWTNYYVNATNTVTDPAELAKLEQYRRVIKSARQDYAASVGVLNSWLDQYQSNIVTKAQVQSAIAASVSSASNIVYLINFIENN